MKKVILVSIAVAASLAAVAPALAQPYGAQYGAGYDQSRPYGGITHRIDYLSAQISNAQQARTINWREANRLRGVLSQVRSQEQQDLSQGGGLNGWQRDRLNQRLDDVAAELRN